MESTESEREKNGVNLCGRVKMVCDAIAGTVWCCSLMRVCVFCVVCVIVSVSFVYIAQLCILKLSNKFQANP